MMENDSTIFSELNSTETEATNTQKILAGLIDFVLNVFILFALYKLSVIKLYTKLVGTSPLFFYLFILIIFLSFRFLLLLFLNKTIGMIICRLKYLNGNLQPLSVKEKLLSGLRNKNSSIRYYQDKGL